MNQIKVMGIRKTHKWHAAMCKIQGQVKIALNMLNQIICGCGGMADTLS